MKRGACAMWFAATRPGGWGHRPGQLCGSAVRRLDAARTKAAKAVRIRGRYAPPSSPGSTVPSPKNAAADVCRSSCCGENPRVAYCAGAGLAHAQRWWSAARRCALLFAAFASGERSGDDNHVAPGGAPSPLILPRGKLKAHLALFARERLAWAREFLRWLFENRIGKRRTRRERVRQNAYRCVGAAARNRQKRLRPSSPLRPVVTRRMQGTTRRACGRFTFLCGILP